MDWSGSDATSIGLSLPPIAPALLLLQKFLRSQFFDDWVGGISVFAGSGTTSDVKTVLYLLRGMHMVWRDFVRA